MNKKTIFIRLLLLVISLTTMSCVKDVDFDQTDEIVLTPVFEADFIYSKINTEDIIDIPTNTVIPVVRDTIAFDLLSTDVATENLERIELFFDFENTIERNIDFTFIFTGSDFAPLHSFTVTANMGTNATPVETEETEIFDQNLINTLSNATKIITEMRVANTTGSLQGELEVKSKATYFVRYEL